MFFSKDSHWGISSLFHSMKMKFWQSVITSKIGSMFMQILSYASLIFSSGCFCFSWMYGSPIFTAISLLASIMVLLNIDLTNLSRKYKEYADLYSSMTGVKEDMSQSNAVLKESNLRLKEEVSLLQGKIKRLEAVLSGMEKIISDAHNLNSAQTAKFTEALNNIIEAADTANANVQEGFAKALLDYENVSDKLKAVSLALELKTSELANTSAALGSTGKDFKKLCRSLETITLRLEQLYNVGIISEKHLSSWSGGLKINTTDSPEIYVRSEEIKQHSIGLQSFCDTLRDMPTAVPIAQPGS